MAGAWSHAVVYIGRHLRSGWANRGWHWVELWAALRGRLCLASMSIGPSLVAPPDDTGVTGGRQVVDTLAESYHSFPGSLTAHFDALLADLDGKGEEGEETMLSGESVFGPAPALYSRSPIWQCR